jgi:hypothetical protein
MVLDAKTRFHSCFRFSDEEKEKKKVFLCLETLVRRMFDLKLDLCFSFDLIRLHQSLLSQSVLLNKMQVNQVELKNNKKQKLKYYLFYFIAS